MTPNVQLCTPEDSNRAAAEAMAALDVGLLPAAENDRLVGMISDRDIATHRVVIGRGPDMPVRDVMTADVKYCFEDQEIDEVPPQSRSAVDNMRAPLVYGRALDGSALGTPIWQTFCRGSWEPATDHETKRTKISAAHEDIRNE
jgi:hypothetical protein